MVPTVPRDDSEMNFVGFRVNPSLDSQIEDLAWDNRMSKSELLRHFCRHGVENADEILADVSEDNRDARSS